MSMSGVGRMEPRRYGSQGGGRERGSGTTCMDHDTIVREEVSGSRTQPKTVVIIAGAGNASHLMHSRRSQVLSISIVYRKTSWCIIQGCGGR